MSKESIAAIIIATIGLILFTILLICNYINQASYAFFIAILSLVCLVVNGFSRVREVDLKNPKIILDKMIEVKKDIYAKEDDLKKTAISLLDIIIFNSDFF